MRQPSPRSLGGFGWVSIVLPRLFLHCPKTLPPSFSVFPLRYIQIRAWTKTSGRSILSAIIIFEILYHHEELLLRDISLVFIAPLGSHIRISPVTFGLYQIYPRPRILFRSHCHKRPTNWNLHSCIQGFVLFMSSVRL